MFGPKLFITPHSIPTILIYLLPFLTVILHLTLVKTTLLFLALILAQCVVHINNLKNGKEKPVLELFVASPFAEYVSWCMDRLQVPFDRAECIGVVGILFYGRLIPTLYIPKLKIQISSSDNILKYLYITHNNTHPQTSNFLTPLPNHSHLEPLFQSLLNHLRRFIYYHALIQTPTHTPNKSLLYKAWGLYQPAVPPYQKALCYILQPVSIAFIKAILNVNQKSYQDSLSKIEAKVEEVERILERNGGSFVSGSEEPTYIDFAFATAGGLMVVHEGYGGKWVEERSRIRIEDFPEDGRTLIEKWRKRKIAGFVERMYRDFRMMKKV